MGYYPCTTVAVTDEETEEGCLPLLHSFIIFLLNALDLVGCHMDQGLKKWEGLGEHDFHSAPFRKASWPHFTGRKAETLQGGGVQGRGTELGRGKSPVGTQVCVLRAAALSPFWL